VKNCWDRIRETLRGFWRPGDELRCVDRYISRGGTCQLCGYSPITTHFVIRNERTEETLPVGVRCVQQIKVAIRSMAESDLKIVFPLRYKDR